MLIVFASLCDYKQVAGKHANPKMLQHVNNELILKSEMLTYRRANTEERSYA